MRPSLVILIGTLCINALLLGLFVNERLSPAPATARPSPKPQLVPNHTTHSESQGTPANLSARTNLPPPFRWSQLESPDFKEYITRLTAFGVPKQTIRDIIVADVLALFRPRTAALRGSLTPSINYWERPVWWGARGSAAQRAELRALEKEQRDLIRSLLGDAPRDESIPGVFTDPLETILTKKNPALLEKIRDLQARFFEKEQELYAKSKGMIDQWAQQDLKAIRDERLKALSKLLSPEELEKYELRTSQTASNLRYNLGGFDASEDEFKAMYRFRTQQEQLTPAMETDENGNPVPPSPELAKARMEATQKAEQDLKQALGEDRYKEYKLMEQPGMSNLAEAGVSKENLFKLDEAKTQAEQAADKIRRNSNLSEDQRTELLRKIRSETMTELNSLLGERYSKAYRSNGGWWLQNIAPGN